MTNSFSDYSVFTFDQLYDALKTSENGLSAQEVEKRLAMYGKNVINQKDITIFIIFKNQFYNPFIWILFAISFAYLFTHQYAEAIVLFILMIVNVSIGFYQEYHSNKAMELLKKYIQSTISVIRDGEKIIVSVDKLVPGDLMILYAGDIIPADCRFIKVENITIDESALTGESFPVKKSPQPVEKQNPSIYEAYNIGFSGTVLMEGEAAAIVFATGKNTSLGSITLLTAKTINKSNLAQGTLRLARIIMIIVVVSFTIITLINIFLRWEYFSFFNFLLFMAALAVSVIPSALPVVITFCLSRGAARLKAHKVIVKRLSSIEDLGGIEVLCTDKTGTLTENSLQLASTYADDENQIMVEALLTSTYFMTKKKHIPKGFDLALMQKMTPEQEAMAKKYTIVKELPFSYNKGRSFALVKQNNEHILITKGMIERVINQCVNVNSDALSRINQWIEQEELQGNRVLAVASKKITSSDENFNIEENDNSYTFTGLLAFHDPLKKGVENTLLKAQTLGVNIKILSGDTKHVCYAIANQLGLEKNIENIILGSEFDNSTEEQKMFLVQNHTIFARVTPEQKYHIIEYLQKNYSVGYLGDGINDAPALKLANVSLAVTDAVPVAREAADILLIEKSLFNIILGIEEGRKIVINTVKYIKITISSNLGNFCTLAFSSLLIDYLPMLPLQLVFLNLLTDFPMIALSTDSVSQTEVRKPLHYNMKDISITTFLFGLISSPFDFMIFMLFKNIPARLQTNWFISSSLTELALIFSLRTKTFFCSAKRPSIPLMILCLLVAAIVLMLPQTQIGQDLFYFVAPAVGDITKIICIVLFYFITTETVKIIYYRYFIS